jgi:hypothetical protein
MFELNEKEIFSAIDANNRESARLDKEIKKIAEKSNALQDKISGLKNSRRQNAYHFAMLRELLLFSRGLPKNVLDIYDEIRREAETAGRTDVLVSTRDNAVARLAELQAELKKICPHTFVIFHQSWYDNEPYNEHWHIGGRLCLICHLEDAGKKQSQRARPV